MKESVLMQIRKWDREHPAMEPVNVPYDCRAVYAYKQPVVCDSLENLPEDSSFEAFDGWGVVTVLSDHVMDPQEKGRRREALRSDGAETVGNLRLVSQTFSRDKDAVTIDELGDMFGDE